MHIAVCDDEPHIVTEMKEILTALHYEVDGYDNPLQLLEKHYPVYFLDIGMDTMSGLEIGSYLRKENPTSILIYVTNFDDYRPQAFGLHAFDYLKKPIQKEDIIRVMKDVEVLLQRYEPALSFHTLDGVLQIKPNDILYFEFNNRYVQLHAKDVTYRLLTNLHTMASMMKSYPFAMPHKSFCINLAHVRLLKGYDITMTNGAIIPLSQKRSVNFRKELNDYLCQRITGGGLHE